MRRFRLSPTGVIAAVALTVALGGTAAAATTIDGHTIKTRTIPGNRLIRNTVTGAEVKESTLAKVPAAAHADKATSATSATSATKVNGLTIKKVFAEVPVGTNTQIAVSSLGHLQILAGCDDAGLASVTAHSLAAAGTARAATWAASATHTYIDQAFAPGAGDFAISDTNRDALGNVTAQWLADKTLVRFDFHYASNDSSGDTGFCLVDGTLTSG